MGAFLLLGVAGCGGGLPEEVSSAETSLELTQVSIEQFGPPVPRSESPELPDRMVSVNVTMAFRAPQRPATLSLVFATLDAPVRSSQSDVDLATVAPDVAASTGGREVFRAGVRVPDLGTLIFDAVLIDHAGVASAPVSGHFTIQDAVSATQSTVVVQSDQSSGQTTP
jgi:hypothetical protein